MVEPIRHTYLGRNPIRYQYRKVTAVLAGWENPSEHPSYRYSYLILKEKERAKSR